MSELVLDLEEGLVGHWTMDSADKNGEEREAWRSENVTTYGFTYDSDNWDRQDAKLFSVMSRGANEYYAEVRGVPTFGQSSPVGEAVDLVESNGDYFPIRNNFYDNTTPVPELTVSAWVNTSNSNQYVMQYDRSEVFRATTSNFSTAASSIDDLGFSGAEDGNWHNIVWWYDSDSTGNRKRVYVDGSVVASKADPHTGEALSINATTTFGSIGAFGGSRSFDGDEDPQMTGKLSDVRLYERALSDSEINALYQMRSPRHATI